MDVSYQSASPSELPSRWSDKVICREITVKEIEEIVDAFTKTARLCKDAGVDGVEVHAVHEGYLIDQFTLKYTNKRTDKYGGSFWWYMQTLYWVPDATEIPVSWI